MTTSPPGTGTRPTEIFAHALRGETTYLHGVGTTPTRLRVEDWTRPADDEDAELLDLCVGSTLDVGCGPGRLAVALGLRGQVTLGIDVVCEAVRQTVLRGGSAMQRDVFGPVPGEGRWETVLLADGNIGIGGDPVALLTRVRQLLGRGGRAVVEVAAPGVRSANVAARLACACSTSHPFPWAVVGVDDVPGVARAAGLAAADHVRLGRRWAVVLEEGP